MHLNNIFKALLIFKYSVRHTKVFLLFLLNHLQQKSLCNCKFLFVVLSYFKLFSLHLRNRLIKHKQKISQNFYFKNLDTQKDLSVIKTVKHKLLKNKSL